MEKSLTPGHDSRKKDEGHRPDKSQHGKNNCYDEGGCKWRAQIAERGHANRADYKCFIRARLYQRLFDCNQNLTRTPYFSLNFCFIMATNAGNNFANQAWGNTSKGNGYSPFGEIIGL